MSYREVDFSVLGQNCERRLKQLENERVEALEKLIASTMNKGWFSPKTREDAIEHLKWKHICWPIYKHKDVYRLSELLTLTRVPGSLNRIVNLSVEDAYIVFGDI